MISGPVSDRRVKLTRLRGVSAGLGDYGSVVMSSLAVSKAMGDR